MGEKGGEAYRVAGAAVAIAGFVVTRFLIAEAVRVDAPLAVLVTTLLPLVVGLALTVVGVSLAVGSFSRTYVLSVAGGTLGGFAVAGVGIGLTLLRPALGGDQMAAAGMAPALAANVLLTGAVAGGVAGDRHAAGRRFRQEVARQSNRALFVTRLLRHEVLNAVSIVRGHVNLVDDGDEERHERSIEAIRRATERIETTVKDVAVLAEADERRGTESVSLTRAVEGVVDDIDADIEVVADADADATVAADGRIALVVEELVTNAVDHAAERVSVSIAADARSAELTVSDDGPGLPATQRALLEMGSFPEYDDPDSGFGLQVVRLLVEHYGGTIGVDADEGTTVVVSLPRERQAETDGLAAGVGVTFPNLRRATVAGLVAGVAMGGAFSIGSNSLPVIGALYGVRSPLLGWTTHLFHSVVFALLFAAGDRSLRPEGTRVAGTVAAAVAWGVTLWAVAAGAVMPLWLRAVGIEAAVPNLDPLGLVSHVVWGVALGGSFAALARRTAARAGDPEREGLSAGAVDSDD